MVVDGTGAPARRADVGITDGRISEIADTVHAREEIDASGRLVTPGFVDIHTHYDAQVLWDPTLEPSSHQGVTSVVAGNCGYSIAPTKARDRASLMRTLDKVEDMRVATLEAGRFVGEMSFLTGQEPSADVVAMGQTSYLAWPCDDLRRFLEEHPEVRSGLQLILGTDLARKLRAS